MNLDPSIVARIQRRLGLPADGEFGPVTLAAVDATLAQDHPDPAPPVIVPPAALAPEDFVQFADGNHNDTWPPPSHVPAFIHKATEGTWFSDPAGVRRRAEFKAQGGLWGWYHFTSGEDPHLQAANFLTYVDSAGHHPDDLICLDFENSSRSRDRNMTPEEARSWMDFVETRLGGKVCIYGSNLVVNALQANPQAFGDRPLWIPWYRNHPPQLPHGRPWALWQFTGDGHPYPDMNRFPGTEATLRAAWPSLHPAGIAQASPPSTIGTPAIH